MFPQLTQDVDELLVGLAREELSPETGAIAPPRRNEMVRVIKRYESRKLYDTEESRYVSLDDVARWVRDGQEVKVVDNASSEDVTHQILTQVILEEGKRGTSFLPKELLHDLVRAGERAVSSSVEQVQSGVDRLMRASLDRLGPVREAREEMAVLRSRLSELEHTLVALEREITEEEAAKKSAEKPAAKSAKKPAAKSSSTRKSAAGTAKKPAAKRKTSPARKKSSDEGEKPAAS